MIEEAPQVEGQVADAAPESEGQAMWYDTASDEDKGYIQNKGWDDPLKAVEGYKNLEKFQGVPPEQLLKLPKDGEPMDDIYNRLGRPETAKEYAFELPDGGAMDTGRLEMYKDAAHAAGISQAQFEALAKADVDYWGGQSVTNQTAIDQKQTAELDGLKQEWGTAFDERAELGRRFIRNNMPEGVDKGETLTAIENAVGTATMLKMFANSGSTLSEDKIPSGDGDRPFGYSREQAISDKKELMQTIQADPARLDNYNKGIGPDLDKMKRLNKVVAG